MKKILNIIGLFFSHIIGNVEDFFTEHIAPAKTLLTLFKGIVDSKVANIFVALTPTDADDKVRAMVSNILAKAIDALYLTAEIVNEPDWTNKLIKAIAHVKGLSEPMRGKFYAALERELIKQSAASNGIKDHVLDSVLQLLHSAAKDPSMQDRLPDTLETMVAEAPAKKTVAKKKAAPIKASTKKVAAPVVQE